MHFPVNSVLKQLTLTLALNLGNEFTWGQLDREPESLRSPHADDDFQVPTLLERT